MKTVTVQAGATIDLGYQYDNYATEVIFPAEIIEPITDAFGSTGTFAIWYRRSGDSLGYPIGSPLVTFDSANDEVTWDIVESDTASPGVSQVQLRYIVDEVCVMSQIFAGNVADSVDTGEEVPEPMEQWADAIIEAVNGVHGIPVGGTNGQVLAKASGTDYDVHWVNQSGGGGGSVTVDSTMSSTSENPVQNKVIYNALQSKANSSDIPTVVSTITAGNTNPVNSVAVIAYINSLDATNTAY